MTRNINAYISLGKDRLDKELKAIFSKRNIPSNLHASMTYSLFASGKRLRPILMFASYDTFAKQSNKVLKAAVALEMIHTYSLIHDDLPAMDNDDYRRGVLTNHRKFDEATAILAGDALLSADEKVFLLHALTKASGAEGMDAGQILDTEGEQRELTLADLEKIHELKTGELISFAITAGAYLANIDEERIQYLNQYAYYLGLIFQVQDDILDVIVDPEKLSNPVGSDLENDKSTTHNLLGLHYYKDQKQKYEQLAISALEKADAMDSYLLDLLHYFSQRDH